MKLPFKLYDPLIAMILAVPIGGFVFGFNLSDSPFLYRVGWGIYGSAVFLQSIANGPSRLLSDGEMFRSLWVGGIACLAILGAVRFYNDLVFPYKKRITAGFVSVAAVLLLFLLLKPLPEDTALARIPPDFKNGSSIDVQLNVPQHRVYYIDLRFGFSNDTERKLAHTLVGDSFSICRESNTCGVVTEFEFTIYDEAKNKFNINKDVKFGPQGHYAYDSESYWRNLGIIALRPGKYLVIIKPINFDELIKSAKIELVIRPDPMGGLLGE